MTQRHGLNEFDVVRHTRGTHAYQKHDLKHARRGTVILMHSGHLHGYSVQLRHLSYLKDINVKLLYSCPGAHSMASVTKAHVKLERYHTHPTSK